MQRRVQRRVTAESRELGEEAEQNQNCHLVLVHSTTRRRRLHHLLPPSRARDAGVGTCAAGTPSDREVAPVRIFSMVHLARTTTPMHALSWQASAAGKGHYRWSGEEKFRFAGHRQELRVVLPARDRKSVAVEPCRIQHRQQQRQRLQWRRT